jgi:hypothetical protein
VTFVSQGSSLHDPHEPTTVKEALSSEDAENWKATMDSEYDSLMKNNTWTLEFLPLRRSIVSCKWILKCKYNAHGKVTQNKTCLVARNFSQEKGIDSDETFSPVVKISSY